MVGGLERGPGVPELLEEPPHAQHELVLARQLGVGGALPVLALLIRDANP